jgi:hypothetical protein
LPNSGDLGCVRRRHPETDAGRVVVVDAGTWRLIGAFMVVLGALALISIEVRRHYKVNPTNPWATRRTVIIGTLGIVTGVVFFIAAEAIAQP